MCEVILVSAPGALNLLSAPVCGQTSGNPYLAVLNEILVIIDLNSKTTPLTIRGWSSNSSAVVGRGDVLYLCYEMRQDQGVMLKVLCGLWQAMLAERLVGREGRV